MARSKYIYLVYTRYHDNGTRLLSAHTVKREACEWLAESTWDEDTAILMRIEDGVSGDRDLVRDGGVYTYKPATIIPWEAS